MEQQILLNKNAIESCRENLNINYWQGILSIGKKYQSGTFSFFSVLIILILGSQAKVHAQSAAACTTQVVQANFGIDGNLYANSPIAGVDDWFHSNMLPGSGIGVIGTTAATATPPISAATFNAILSSATSATARNRTYVQRMSVPFGTVVNGMDLLDAVAARDNIAVSGTSDSSIFTSSDKNGDNPLTWTVGVGSIPHKDDLIDVGGHIRVDLSTNHLWGFAYATLLTTNGDSHLDFEIFRTIPVFDATTGVVSNTGPAATGGHTAGLFNVNGTVASPGDVLIAIDYTNGGTNPVASVRIWINPNDVDGLGHNTAYINAQPLRPFNFTGVFDAGVGTNGYGYAEISPLVNGCLIWSLHNEGVNCNSLGTPWGNLSTSSGTYTPNLECRQLVEVAIDFTAFGLDINPPSGPCFILFGSLLVKSRSSQSFTAQLKDYVGPFPFGNFIEIQANAGPDTSIGCGNSTVTLQGSSITPGASFSWTAINGGHIVSGANTPNPIVDQPGCYILTAANPDVVSCTSSDTVCVTLSTPPNANAGPDKALTCLVTTVALSGSSFTTGVNFSWTAINGGNIVSGANTATPIVNAAGCYVLTVTNPSNNCTSRDTACVTANIDNTPPTLTCPPPVTIQCLTNLPVCPSTLLAFTGAGGSATDLSLPLTFNCTTGPLVGNACGGTVTRIFTVTDACGNSSTCSQAFTIHDTIAPVITSCPGGGALGCNPVIPGPTNPIASDNCSTPVITSVDAITSNGCNRTLTRTYTVTDACGNSASCTQVYTYTLDTVAPVITATGTTLTLGCNPSATAINAALGTATASDGCGPVTPTAATGTVTATGCSRSQTRTWNATDACGNNALAVSRTITWTLDTVAPVITATGTTLTLACNPTAAAIDAALGHATASDGCGPVTPTATTSNVTATGCSRSQTRTWNATDACGNNALSVSRTITWTLDTVAPVITATGTTLTLACNPTAAAIDSALGHATATDGCGPVTPTATTSNVTATGCSRSQTRTWNATDACGNNALSVSRTITWTLDTVAPVITATGTTLTLACNPTAAAIDAALGTATASDGCGPVTPTATTGTVTATGCSRSQTRTWNATDACGNNALSVSRTITWTLDTVAPVITATGTTLTLACNPTAAAIDAALGTATATDGCGPVTPTATTGNVTATGCSRSQTRTWNATDACGNNALSVSRTITWTLDTVAPVITATGTTLTLACNPSAAAIDAALGTATASDGCGPVTPTATTSNVTATGCSRSQTRTWNATDACGNNALAVSRTITWTLDTVAPVITATGTTLTLACNPTAAAIDSALGHATASDGCGPVTPTATTSNVTATGCSRSQTRTWNATDACGNNALAVSRTITWTLDTVAPVITATGTTLTLACNPTAAAIDAALGTATASDGCGPVTPTETTGTVTATGCSRSQTRTWNATDACGNNALSVSRTITWTLDTVAPVITATGTTLTLACNPTAAAIDAALGTATATDGCGPVTPTATTGTVTATGCSRSQTRTWNATDACGNNALSVSRTITWTLDTVAPVITATGTTLTLACNPTAAAIDAALGTATATDGCGPVTPTATTGTVTATGCSRSQTRTWNATDACGNNALAVSRTITWTLDTVAPVITATGTTLTLACNPTAAAIDSALGTATASDGCGPVTPTATTSNVTATGCSRSQTRTWNATDACGNNALAVSRTITWTLDTVAPVITATGTTLTLACNPTAAAIDAALGTATASDGCGPVTPTATTGTVTATGCSRSQTRTWNATDACGNNALSVSRTITWTLDTVAPVITATGTTLTLACNPTAAAIDAALGTATASDGCGPVTPTATTSNVTATGCSRSQTRTWNATDACGNNALSVSRTITWTLDTVAPVITATGTTLTLACNPTAAAIDAALGTATASDGCGPVTPTATTSNVTATGCSRSQTRTWNATDACGNNALSVSRTITWTLDTVAPVITATGTTLTLACNPTAAAIDAALGTATATDGCGPVTPTATTSNVTATGCSRSQTRTWNATDACGNNALAVSRTITWTLDTVAPVITATGTTLTLACNPTAAAIDSALGHATASDGCGPVTPTATTSNVTATGCSRSQTRTWNATDACGNNALAVSRTITWTLDTVAPVITATGTTLTLACNPTAAAIDAALGTATASDGCGPVTPTATTSNVTATGCSRSQTRTWNATDACGNNALSVSRTITWTLDTVAPVITATGTTLTLACNPSAAAIDAALGTATATDGCGPVTPTATTGTVTATGCSRSQTRTWNATDACGNNALAVSRTITWTLDTVAPVITATGTTLTLACNPTAAAIDAALGTATATDGCGPVTPTATTGTVTATGCSRSQTRTWNATDACGNNALAVSRTITWTLDTVAPVITATGTTLTLACNPTAAAIDAALGTATATDGCGPVTPTATTSNVTATGCSRSQTRTWNATDACGNNALSVSRTITWTLDTVAPVITATGTTLTLACNPTAAAIDAALGTATATDGCGPVIPTATTGTVTATGCSRSQTRTWNATDACGNNALSVSRTITWTLDTVAPVITATGTTLTLACNPTAAAIDAALGTATATDGCGPVTPTATTSNVTATGCSRSQTRTWNATDACGNNALAVSRTITWTLDTVAPVITATGTTLTLACNPTVAAIDAALGTATASDGCGPVTPTATTGTVTATGCSRSQTRTWNAIDACGNNALAVSRTVTWTLDTVAPVIACPGNITHGLCNNTVTYTASATDNCGPVTPTFSIPSGSVFPLGTTTVTVSATDACGNTGTCTFTVTIVANPIANCSNSGIITCFNPTSTLSVNGCVPAANTTYSWTGPNGFTSTSQCPAVSDSGTYTVVVTDITTSCTSTCTTHVNKNATPPPCSIGNVNPSNLICNHGNYTISTSLNPAQYSFSWSMTVDGNPPGWGIVGSNTGQTITFSSGNCGNAGFLVHFTLTVTDETNGCTSTCTVSVAPGAPACNVDIRPPVLLNCITTSQYLLASYATDILNPAFMWTRNGVSIGSGINDGVSLDSILITQPGTYRFTLTDPVNGANSCFAEVTVIQNTSQPNCSLSPPSSMPDCGSSGNTLCVNNMSGTISFHWTLNGGAGWVITSGANASCVTYTAGSDSATFMLVVTNTVSGCSDTCTVLVHCVSPYWGCTLGFWKNHPALWNNVNDPISQCVANAISSLGGAYSGNGTTSSSFMTTFGVTATQMTAAGYSPSLTLLQALNLGGGGFQKLARQGVASLLNTCGLSGNFIFNSTQVLTNMHNAIVNNSPEPVATQFANANETQPDNCPSGGGPADPHAHSLRPGIIANDDVTISAYPNPFSSKTTIEFSFTNATPAVKLDIFDQHGGYVSTLFKGDVDAGIIYRFELDGDKLIDGIYFYRITTPDNSYNEKIILIK